MQAGLGKLLLGLAEAQLDGALVGLDGVDRLKHPEHQHRQRDQPEKGRIGAGAARQCALQPVLAAADDVFEVGRGALRAAGPRGPCPHGPPPLPLPHGPPLPPL